MSYVDLFINSVNSSIHIFRYGKNLYFKNKEIKEPILITVDSIKVLKEFISFPVKIQFEAVSRAQMGRIVKDLLEDDVKVIKKTFYKKVKSDYKILCHDVFLEKNIIKPKQKLKTLQK